jgi:hypothetical protein
MPLRSRATAFSSWLQSEGFAPKIDGDGDVVFKFEGKVYYIDVDNGDEEFFRLVFPNFWEIETGTEMAQAHLAANYASRSTKVAKVYIIERNVCASFEVIMANPDDFQKIFARGMSTIRTAVKEFIEQMK